VRNEMLRFAQRSLRRLAVQRIAARFGAELLALDRPELSDHMPMFLTSRRLHDMNACTRQLFFWRPDAIASVRAIRCSSASQGVVRKRLAERWGAFSAFALEFRSGQVCPAR